MQEKQEIITPTYPLWDSLKVDMNTTKTGSFFWFLKSHLLLRTIEKRGCETYLLGKVTAYTITAVSCHTHTRTCHAVAFHATHFVLRFQRGQQGSPDGDAIHHSAELENNRLFLQALRKLRELIGFHRSLIDAGRFVRGLRGGGVLSVRRLTAWGRGTETSLSVQSCTCCCVDGSVQTLIE